MTIDAHAHLGYDRVFDVDFAEEALHASQKENGIDTTIVQPAAVHDLAGVQQQHDAIADLCSRHPGRFYGVANPNPHLPDDQYETEVARCLEELGFVGIKLHPFAHAVNPGGRDGRRVFEAAAHWAVPLMVHTGTGLPWSAPALLRPLATEFSALTIVVAHGGGMLAAEAALLAADCPNVYLECSWTGGHHVLAWTQRLGADRLLFGADHAENAATELAKLRTCGVRDQELEMILGGTAAAVYDLSR